MSEHYLPIKESLGYKNVKKALGNIFEVDLDTLKIDIGEYEGFGFPFTYNNIPVYLGITDTGKNIQFQAGEGGIFSMTVSNPRYPKDSFQKRASLSYLISDENISNKLRWCLGRNEKDVEYAMRVLKDFLDSDEAKPLLEKKSVILEPESIDIIEVVDGHLELLLADPNVWSELTEQDHLLKLQEKLNNYIHYIETKQYVEKYGDDFDKKVINMTFQYSPSDNGRDFLAQVQEILQPTDISLKIVLPE